MSSMKPHANTPQKLRGRPASDIYGQGSSAGLASQRSRRGDDEAARPFEDSANSPQPHAANTPVPLQRRQLNAGRVAGIGEARGPPAADILIASQHNQTSQLSRLTTLPHAHTSSSRDHVVDLTAESYEKAGENGEGLNEEEDFEPDAIEEDDDDDGGGLPLYDTNYYPEEDVFSDSEASVVSEDDYTIPDAIRTAEQEAEGATQIDSSTYEVHRRYKGFLKALCDATATRAADEHTWNGLGYAIKTAKSLRLDEMKGDRELELYAFALVIHIWQIVCLRLQHGEYPSEGYRDSLSTFSGTYFLSAHSIVAMRCSTLAVSELKVAVEYWEKRLRQIGGGIQWLKDHWAKDIVQLDEDPTFHRNTTADFYLHALETGLVGHLTGAVIEEEAKNDDLDKTQLRKMAEKSRDSYLEVRRDMDYMLHTMEMPLLQAIIQGQVPRLSMIPSGDVYNILAKLDNTNPIQPGIYMNSICDRMGMSPSPAQWSKVCDLMGRYVQADMEHNDIAEEIDQKIHPQRDWPRYLANRGLRRYMEWRSWVGNGKREFDEHHRKMVGYFIGQLQDRMEGQQHHTPLTVPVVELGFSNNPPYRLRQHRHHQSSNDLMNLAEAVFEYQYPGFFTLQQHIIYNCWRPVQTWMSEIVFTQLAQGYVQGGGGFSHEPAGRSITSSFKTLTDMQWQGFEAGVLAAGDLHRKVRENLEYVRKKKAEEAELHLVRMRHLEAQKELVRANTRLIEAQIKLLT